MKQQIHKIYILIKKNPNKNHNQTGGMLGGGRRSFNMEVDTLTS